eukprot:6958417-Alexandrium_andersonii.AAC.1
MSLHEVCTQQRMLPSHTVLRLTLADQLVTEGMKPLSDYVLSYIRRYVWPVSSIACSCVLSSGQKTALRW